MSAPVTDAALPSATEEAIRADEREAIRLELCALCEDMEENGYSPGGMSGEDGEHALGFERGFRKAAKSVRNAMCEAIRIRPLSPAPAAKVQLASAEAQQPAEAVAQGYARGIEDAAKLLDERERNCRANQKVTSGQLAEHWRQNALLFANCAMSIRALAPTAPDAVAAKGERS